MRTKQAGSFNSGGTPTLEAFTPSVSATWTPSVKASRTWANDADTPGSCYTYITQPDGTIVKLPFITPRAERKQRVKQAIVKNTTRLDRSEAARLAPVDHDYNDQ